MLKRESEPVLRVSTKLPQDVEVAVGKILRCAVEVHRTLGPGFVETVYETALCHELTLQNLKYERQKPILVRYKNIQIPGQRLDLVVEDKVIVEMKVIESYAPIHKAQILSYLRTTGIRVGLLINFKVDRLKDGIRRIVL